MPPRTLQEFLSQLPRDQDRAEATLHRLIADLPVKGRPIAVMGASGYPKRGDKTPAPGSVQRQWCGERGKKDNFRGCARPEAPRFRKEKPPHRAGVGEDDQKKLPGAGARVIPLPLHHPICEVPIPFPPASV
ncbi:MAG: transposase [Phycisphaerales bacterium]